jgi:hypothetical protein
MAIGREITPLMTRQESQQTFKAWPKQSKGDARKRITEEPSPTSQAGMAIQRVVDAGLQESAEYRRN